MKKLAIIGAGYMQEPLVRKAKEMGIETHCFAWEEEASCRLIADYFYPISIIDKELILEKCKEIEIDGITSIASDTAVSTICFVAEELGLISNTYQSSLVTTNKYLMRQRLSDFGVKSPHFTIARSGFSIEGFKFPLIVKPTDRSGSRGVLMVDQKTDIEYAVKRAMEESFYKQVIIEEFVAGKEISVESISWEGKHYVLAITDKGTTGYPFFVEVEHHQPTHLSTEIQVKVRSVVQSVLSALYVDYGASHSEFKISAEGEVYVIEVGARMGGDFIGSDLVKLSTGYDYVKGVIEVALGIFEEPVFTKHKYSGIYFLCKETEHVKSYIENYTLYPEIVSAKITDSVLHPIQCSADRSGYFIYQADKKMKI